jgi:hypothetical protein
MPQTKLYLLAVLALALCSTGCRNCGCGGAGASPFGAWRPFGGSLATTVPAPPTNSLNIPQTAQQLPYYVVPNAQNGLQQQPTPANAIPNYQVQPQQGWRQVNPNNSGVLNQNLNPTSFTQSRINSNLPATGTSQTLNPNYQTTSVDERTDSSRLAVTDASQVRAPARFFPTANNNRLIQTPVATTAAAVPNPQFAQTGFGQPVNTLQAGNPTAIQGNVVYQGQLANNTYNNQYGVNPYGNGQIANYGVNPPVTSTSPTVLAQSTTDRTNVARNSQSGWRSANPGAQNLNR